MKKEIYGIAVGSNLGDRLGYIRKAIKLFSNYGLEIIEISRIYETEALLLPNSPDSWNIPYYNLVLKIRTDVLPEVLLRYLKAIEAQVGRKLSERWSPRELDLDILVWNHGEINLPNLKVPHLELTNRLFALQPLLEVWPGDFLINNATLVSWVERLQVTETLKLTPFRVDRPALVGIINLSAESFSDHDTVETGIKKVHEHFEQGCEYIDVGGISTAPDRTLMDENTEWDRLKPFLEKFPDNSAYLSVDTFRLSIMRKLLDYPVKIVNDQSGDLDEAKLALFRNTDWQVVVMDNLGLPAQDKYFKGFDILEEVYRRLCFKLEAWTSAGLSLERFIFDPGIGFGKNLKQNLLLLDNLHIFRNLGVKILVGHSRKSYLTKWHGNSACNLDDLTGAVSYHLKNEVDYLRIHQPIVNRKWLEWGIKNEV